MRREGEGVPVHQEREKEWSSLAVEGVQREVGVRWVFRKTEKNSLFSGAFSTFDSSSKITIKE